MIEWSKDALLAHQLKGALRENRSARSATFAANTIRIRGVEALPRQLRLPHRDHEALLLSSAPAAPRSAQSAHYRKDRRALPSWQAGRHPSMEFPAAPRDYARRTYAEFASTLSRLDA